MKTRNFLMCFWILAAPFAHAGYLAIGESGEMLRENEYQFGVAPQLLLSDGGGGNIDVFLDTPFNDSTSFRLQAGAGKVDFHAGAGVKFIPFPDVDRQPALGGKLSLWYARVSNENALTLQIAPMLSKRFLHEDDVFSTYVAVAANVTSAKSRNYTATQFVVGTDARFAQWSEALLSAEVALKLNDDAFSALTLSAAFPFDGNRGFRRR